MDKEINDYCEYTAIREEGSTEGTISVMLPRGECTVVVYDDEDVEVENPAYNTTLIIFSSSVEKPSGILPYTYSEAGFMICILNNIGCASNLIDDSDNGGDKRSGMLIIMKYFSMLLSPLLP